MYLWECCAKICTGVESFALIFWASISFASHKFAQIFAEKYVNMRVFFALHKIAKYLGERIAGKCALLFACIFGTKFSSKICNTKKFANFCKQNCTKKQSPRKCLHYFLCKFLHFTKNFAKICAKKQKKLWIIHDKETYEFSYQTGKDIDWEPFYAH